MSPQTPTPRAMAASVRLNSGERMPLLGLGTAKGPREEVAAAVEAALLAGYRLIDTAAAYGNEQAVGDGVRAALRSDGISRSDLFVVTKLPSVGLQQGKVERCLKTSLELLGLDYVDLYLVHSPVGIVGNGDSGTNDGSLSSSQKKGKIAFDYSTDLIAVWKDMEKMVTLGLTKNIGLSNFTDKQVTRILSNAKIPPAALQVECHVVFQQHKLREICKECNIAFMAYAPLGSPGRKASYQRKGLKGVPDLFINPMVRLVAEKHSRTPAQALLRFLVQQDVIVIPKSTSEKRIRENGDIFGFNLDDLDMAVLQALDQGEAGRSFSISYVMPGAEEHPEFPF